MREAILNFKNRRQEKKLRYKSSFDKITDSQLILVLADDAAADYATALCNIIEDILNMGLSAEVILFRENLKNNPQTTDKVLVVSAKSFDRWGRIEDPELTQLLGKHFEFLLCLTTKVSVYSKFVMLHSFARFKLGTYDAEKIVGLDVLLKSEEENGLWERYKDIKNYMFLLTKPLNL